MGLLNSFSNVGSNASIGGAIAHKQRHQRHCSSTRSSLASEDLPRSSVSDIDCIGSQDNKLLASGDKNREDDANHIPIAGAIAGNHAFAENENGPLSFSQVQVATNAARTTNKVTLSKRWIPKKTSGILSSFKSSKRYHLLPGESSTSSSCGLAENLQEIRDHRGNREDLERDLESHLAEACLPQQRTSIVSSALEGSLSKELSYDASNDNDLDQSMIGNESLPPDAKFMLENLGDFPSSSELANAVAVCAEECITECVSSDAVKQEGNTTASSGVLDREKWESIPQYSKSEVIVQRHLGKGSFSDAFEVSVMVAAEEQRLDSNDKEDLDRRIEAKFAKTKNICEGGEEEEGDDLDVQIDAMFTAAAPLPATAKPMDSTSAKHQIHRRPDRARRQSTNQGVSISFCVHDAQASPVQKKEVTYAMKCLRPQIRSNADQCAMGVEDLIHETTMLASLDHPNIIKLHGRAVCDSFRLADSYFILLDRLQGTLEDRIEEWRDMGNIGGRRMRPSSSQLETACSIADALVYLHSNNVAFRDLKPANVGFDEQGVLKLFDFGFAANVGDSRVLHDICGTKRYMAPEVGLGRGHSLPVDIYSFGILLWEILSLETPFGDVESKDAFIRMVFEKGVRPKLPRQWAPCLKDVMKGCWSSTARKRPAMAVVAGILGEHARDVSLAVRQRNKSDGSWMKSFSIRRNT